VSSDRNVVNRFGDTIFQGNLSESLFIPQIISDSGEIEYLISYGTNAFKKINEVK
jgi:hypothetical protein